MTVYKIFISNRHKIHLVNMSDDNKNKSICKGLPTVHEWLEVVQTISNKDDVDKYVWGTKCKLCFR